MRDAERAVQFVEGDAAWLSDDVPSTTVTYTDLSVDDLLGHPVTPLVDVMRAARD